VNLKCVKEKKVDSNPHKIKNYLKQDDVICIEKNMMVSRKMKLQISKI